MNASAPILAPVQPGDVLRSKYCVEGLLGQGGMAFVVSARHLHLEQRVAIKLLRPETVAHPEVVARFLREARAASKLESVHVTRVLDVDTLESGAPFIVMEHLEGKDLGQVIDDRKAVPWHEAAAWVREACLGVAEAHAQGIIHRDLKPSNLFLAKKRAGGAVIKVLDFGISKLMEDTRITQTAVGMGSAAYMSPEQMRSAADVDARSDVWSLGVTLHELLTGKTPFAGDSVAVVCTAVLTGAPPSLHQARPDVPPGLEAVVLRCLSKDPAQRFSTVLDLASALAPFTSPVVTAPSAPPPRAAPPPGAAPPPSVAPAPERRGVPLLAAASVVVAVAIVGIVAFAVGRRHLSPAGPAASAAPAASARFKLAGETLFDTATQLTWQRVPAARGMDWAAAKAYCPRLGAGFRLPELDELGTLVAVALADPPLDAVNFATTPIDVFWSSTPAGVGAAMVVHFSDGRRTSSVISARNRVRCVR